MARPRKLETDELLDRCVPLFWQKGYEGTSMRDIEQHTGLTPGSLYHAFGNKRALFVATLERYVNTLIARRIRQHLIEPVSALEGVKRFLTSLFAVSGHPMEKQACLLVKSAFELGDDPAEIGQAIRQGLLRVELGLQQAVMRAQQQGELPADLPAGKVARHLSILMPGLLMAHRNGATSRQLEDQVEWALSLLR